MLPIISVEHLYKQYRLGTINHGMLRKDLQSWWARARGKEDPNVRIAGSMADKTRRPAASNDRFWALDDVSFDVEQGEVLGIIGQNGAGKSTLLKILSKVTTPTRGEIRLKGRVASLLEVGTGFHPELTGRENVFLNGAILGMTKTEVRRKFDEIVSFAELERFIDTPVKRYSSGMYVRLAFAVAAHLEPEILLVDEVLAVGDSQFQRKCLGKMGEIGKEGRTVLLVSHNMAAIRRLSAKTLLLENGKLAGFGDAQSIVAAYLDKTTEDPTSQDGLPPGFIYRMDRVKPETDYAITAIQLLDRQGRPLTDLGTWDYVCFRIFYSAAKVLKRGSVVLQIQTQEAVPLILASTEPDSMVPLPIGIGDSYADCIFPRFPISEGQYLVGAGLAIPLVEHVIWNNSLCQLSVSQRDVFKTGLPPSSKRYLVATDLEWRLPPK